MLPFPVEDRHVTRAQPHKAPSVADIEPLDVGINEITSYRPPALVTAGEPEAKLESFLPRRPRP
jgi:hypothetical protein